MDERQETETMSFEQWQKELKSYRTPKRAVDEILVGLEDHLEGEGACVEGMTVIEYVRNQYTGVGPVKTSSVCSRGTRGCNKEHNDTTALVYMLEGLRRVKELVKAD